MPSQQCISLAIMLSPDSQLLLAKIMLTLGHTELHIETSRLSWAASAGFNPLAIFRKLDHLNTGYITIEDLSIYLADHQVRVPLPEQLFLFSWFDSNGDGKATYEEFVRRLRPVDYPREVGETLGKYGTPDSDFDFLSVVLRELECVKAVLGLASEFAQRPDYSLSRAFFAVSKGKKDIGVIVLGRFLEQTLGQSLTPSLLHAIIERLDLDEDGRISQKDLSIFLQRITHILAESDSKPSSPLKLLRVKEAANGLFRTSENGPIVEKNGTLGSAVDFFVKVIACQKDLEISRQRLATEHEISLLSLFRSFDREKKGVLTLSDFEFSLSTLQIPPNSPCLSLLIRHYDSDKDGCLSQGDFCRMVLSASPEYNELYCLEGRRRAGLGEISGNARETMRGIIEELMKFEGELEHLRGKLREKEIDLRGLFGEMDVDQSEAITVGDLKQYLAGKQVFPSLLELVALIELLDGNRDGKVDYSEFLESLSPKSISDLAS